MTTENEYRPLIQKFLNMFEVFLETSHLPHYSCFPDVKKLNDPDYVKYVTESCSVFVEAYIRCNVSDQQKYKMIAEYGMKKLIDLQISYEGNSICEELLDLSEHIDTWVHMLLMNVIMLY